MPAKKQFETVDDYIKTFPKDVQSILEKVRRTIKRAAPEAEETISYQMPTFKLNGSYLAHFASFRKHIGLYPPAPREFKKEVSSYEGPKGILKFPIDKPIPYDLLNRIVAFRRKEILQKKK